MDLYKVTSFKYRAAETAAVILPPILLFFCALWEVQGTAFAAGLVLVVSILPFFADFEHSKPRPRDMVPIAVLSTIAALGRTMFAAIPSFNPASAVVLITGISLGPQAGFLSGALAALASNMLLGQGPWTPWQMYAWGMIGFVGGLFQRAGLFKKPFFLYAFGFFSGILFGWFMDLYYVIGFIKPLTSGAIIASFAASAFMDVTHGLSTVLFLVLLKKTWCQKLSRLKMKYGICGGHANG